MLGLTIPQAAATLAATIVGFNIGLFDQSVVNAALVLILVSIVVGTLLVDRAVPTVPPPEGISERIGSRILVALTDPRQAVLAFQLAARIAAAEGGVVRGLLASPRDQAEDAADRLGELDAAAYAAGIDAESRLLVHDSLAESIVNVATENRASLVIVGRPSTPGPSAFGSTGEAIAAALAAPVAILVGEAERIREVEVVREPEHVAGSFDADGIAVELGRRIGGTSVEVSRPRPRSAGGAPPRPAAAAARDLLAAAGRDREPPRRVGRADRPRQLTRSSRKGIREHVDRRIAADMARIRSRSVEALGA